MFLDHFQFAEQPFGATPDPRFLFPSASHREALASLYCGYVANRGFTALIAEPGMGKTTLLFEFLRTTKERARTAFIFNTLCDARDLISGVLRDLGVEPSTRLSDCYCQLNMFLSTEARAGRRVVLVVDEAQNLSAKALEAIRLLTNFETPTTKLMQIVLAGQPQLAENLAKPEMAQLLQRISTVCRIMPLSATEVTAYIDHRLRVAGYSGKTMFTSDAIELIADVSHGTPRLINNLCFNALCLCRARHSKLVDKITLEEVLADLQLKSEVSRPAPGEISNLPLAPQVANPRTSYSRRKKPMWYAAAVLGGTAIAGAGLWAALDTGRPGIPAAANFGANRSQSGTDAGNARVKETQAIQPAGNVVHFDQTAPAVETIHPVRSDTPITVTINPGDTLKEIATRRLGRWDSALLREILLD